MGAYPLETVLNFKGVVACSGGGRTLWRTVQKLKGWWFLRETPTTLARTLGILKEGWFKTPTTLARMVANLKEGYFYERMDIHCGR